jgi:hypothetical protein
MTELLDIGQGEIEAWGFEEKSQASVLKEEVESLLDEIGRHEKTLSRSYVRLGLLTDKAIQGRCWIGWGYESSGAFVDSICARIGRQRSAVYEFAAISQKLLPQISQADLETMGISKASLLKRYVQQSGRRVEPGLLASALDDTVTVAQLKTIVYNSLKQTEDIKGVWRDWGAYYEPDQWAEIQQAAEVAKREVPIDPNLPDHMIRRDVLLAFAREFLGTYSK